MKRFLIHIAVAISFFFLVMPAFSGIPVLLNCKTNSFSISSSGPTQFCPGDSVVLTASAADAYIWYPTGETTASITVKTSGIYSCKAFFNASDPDSAQVEVFVYPLPESQIVSGGGTNLCLFLNPSAVVRLSGSETGVRYHFYKDTPDSILQTVEGTGSPLDVNVPFPNSGSIMVDAVSLSTGCGRRMEGSAMVSFLPVLSGYMDADADGFGAVPVSVCWHQPGFVFVGGDCNDHDATIYPGASRGCSGDHNCDGEPDYHNPTLFVEYESGHSQLCFGDSALISAWLWDPILEQNLPLHANGLHFSISWSSNPPGLPFSQISEDVILVKQAGEYKATVYASIDGNSCNVLEASTSINSVPVPDNFILVEGSASFCKGDSVLLKNSNPDYNVVWQPGGQTDQSIWVKTTGTYQMQTAYFECPAKTDEVEVTVLQEPFVNAGSDFSILQGQPDFQFSPLPPGGTWSGSGVTSTGLFSCHQVVGLYPLVYSYTNPLGCHALDTVVVTILPPVLAKPLINPPTGTYSDPLQATITCGTPGVQIYYTTSGNNPVVGTYFTKLYSGPFSISASGTIRAMAVLSGYPNSSIAASFITITNPGLLTAPTFTPAPGSYPGSQTIVLTTNRQDASIYYTTNGNTPRIDIPNSFTSLYNGPFLLSNSAQVKAIAVKANYFNSSVSSGYYSISNAKTSTPVISPSTGIYTGIQEISMACSTPNSTIYYTTNGNTPVAGTTFTKVYTVPFFLSQNATVKAIATASGFQNSANAVSYLTIMGPEVVSPVHILPEGGPYQGVQTITLSTSTEGAFLYYTLNGNTPRLDIPNSFTYLYTAPFALSSSAIVKAIATKPEMINSPLAYASYFITSVKTEKPAISPPTGSYNIPIIVSIACNTPGSSIYYTTNGNVPVVGTSFTKVYTGDFSLGTSGTIRALGVTPGFQNSDVAVSYLTATPVRKELETQLTNYEASRYRIYPNPTDDLLFIENTDEVTGAEIEILDPIGRLVLQRKLTPSGPTEISLLKLPSGLYRLIIRSGTRPATFSLVKSGKFD